MPCSNIKTNYLRKIFEALSSLILYFREAIRSPSTRSAKPWSAIQTQLHHMMSNTAVLAQELLDDCAKSCSERRAASLRQIPLNNPKRQLPAQICHMLSRAKSLLSLDLISLFSEFSKACRMYNLKHACNLKCRKYEYQIFSDHPDGLQCGGVFTHRWNDVLTLTLFETTWSLN